MSIKRLAKFGAAGAIFLLAAGAVPAQAGGRGGQDSAPVRDTKPLVMLFLPNRDNAKTAAKNDPNAALRILLRDTLRDSGKYRVLAFNPQDPVVVRALREHTIASADVTGAVTPEIMQRLGKAFGARYVVSVVATLDKDALTTAMRLLESVGTEDWRTVYADQSAVPLVNRKKRLKFDDAIAIAADGVLVRFGFPAHNLSKINADAMEKAEQRIAKKDKTDKPATTPDDKKPSRAAENNPNDNGDAPKTSGDTHVKPSKKAGNQNARPPKENAHNTLEKNIPNKTPTRNGKGKNDPEPDPKNDFSAFTTDGAAGRDTQPTTPNVAPPPVGSKQDEEAALERYRQAGDLANVILSLRKAINDRPRDTTLRRQLIQAYQDRQMPDAALEETNRALQISPDDAGLYRFYGNGLLAKGDISGALKAFREAIQRDPKDILSQVALADALMADNQFGDAQTAYEDAAKADPNSPLPHRRMANALARRAVGDASQYAASLEQVRLAHALLPPTDTESYLADYTALARLMEARLRDMLNELQGDFQAQSQGKLTGDALKRALADLKLRSEAVADYLDKLPPASGHDVTHAHYQQGAALLLQAVSLFRDYAATADPTTLSAFKGAQVDASRELTAGAKSLAAAP